jgi:Ni2+-binding GTPase involved in maturation of urease and hydrogenase
MRGDKPFVMTNLKTQAGLEQVIDFVTSQVS